MTAAFRVVIVSPPGYRHSAAFHEVAESLHHAIRSLGYPSSVGYNRFAAGATHIVLGSNLVGPDAVSLIPPGSVIYNLEQIDAQSRWWHAGLQTLVNTHETWDYSRRNIETFASLGVTRPVHHVPIGYVPELTRIPPAAVEDIDVLFYGSTNERRAKVLDALRARGLNVVQLFGMYGRERDAHIARAKVVLSLHLYPAKILETVRVSYLLANHKAVVAECESDTAFEPGIDAAVRLAPYEKIVEATVALVASPAERAQLADAGYRWITGQPLAATLAPHLERLARAAESAGSAARPTRLRFGGFQAPIPDWLCVDEANPAADVQVRTDSGLPMNEARDTLRFGRVALEAESFDEIDAGDWPARTADFEGFMRDCARLLRFGGVLRVRVPHDLSADAWARPGTRRVFSERSFNGFADAHIALSWGDCALELKDLRYELSEFGATLKAQGADADNLVRTPRTVDRIVATLERRGYRALPGA
jgi:hypothetical protein